MPIADVDAAFGQAADERRFKHRRVGPAVAADGEAWRLPPGERGKAAAERVSVRLGQRVADDAADVIFAQDGGVEAGGSSRLA